MLRHWLKITDTSMCHLLSFTKSLQLPTLIRPPYLHNLIYVCLLTTLTLDSCHPAWSIIRLRSFPYCVVHYEDIISVLQRKRLRWYGHVLRKEDNDWVKKCMEYEVEGRPQRCGSPHVSPPYKARQDKTRSGGYQAKR